MKVDFTKYNTAARICNHVFNLLKRKIENNEVLDISHPWASGPESIGSLALIYFGICYK